MPKYFLQGTKHEAWEKMMMEPPHGQTAIKTAASQLMVQMPCGGGFTRIARNSGSEVAKG